MNCPGCGAAAARQKNITEGRKECTTCNCVWQMTESGASIIKEGQSFLSEVPDTSAPLL